jgi:hypothetical protein
MGETLGPVIGNAVAETVAAGVGVGVAVVVVVGGGAAGIGSTTLVMTTPFASILDSVTLPCSSNRMAIAVTVSVAATPPVPDPSSEALLTSILT